MSDLEKKLAEGVSNFFSAFKVIDVVSGVAKDAVDYIYEQLNNPDNQELVEKLRSNLIANKAYLGIVLLDQLPGILKALKDTFEPPTN